MKSIHRANRARLALLQRDDHRHMIRRQRPAARAALDFRSLDIFLRLGVTQT
jgi:hypothetical protein